MLDKSKLIEIVGNLIIEARNSGVNTCLDIEKKEWFPKNPDNQQKDVIDLIDSLSDEQRKKLINVIGYFIDLSFFKLMDTIDNGYKDINFELSITNDEEKITFGGKDSEFELSLKYWIWLSKYGIEGTAPW
jgi:hypothetical protein